MNKKNSHLPSPTINNTLKRNILVLSQAHDGGEWITVRRFLEAVNKYSVGFRNMYLITIGYSQSSKLNFLKHHTLLPHSTAAKPFSFIKKLIKDIVNIKGEIDKLAKNKPIEVALITNHLMVPALLTSNLNNKTYLYFFLGIKTPKDKNFWELDYRQMITRVLETIAPLMAKAIIVPSRQAELLLRKMLGYIGKSKKYFIVPNYLPSEFFLVSPRPSSVKKSQTILYSGRISKYKGLENLIDAFLEFKNENKDSILTVAYPSSNIDETLFQYLQNKTLQKNVNNDIKFLPDRNTQELIRIYVDSDVLVLPSEIELAPLSMLEALASGTPVIGTDVGNIKEVLSKLDPSLVLKDNEVKTILKGLIYFFGLGDKRINELRQKAVSLASRYSYQNTASAFIQVLKSSSS